MGQTFQMAGWMDPTKIDGGRKHLLPLHRQLESFRREDPPPRPQLAIPISFIVHLQQVTAANTTNQDIADLVCNLTFFFLLRIVEYTMPTAAQRTRTVQFRVQDVCFYGDGLLLECWLPFSVLA